MSLVHRARLSPLSPETEWRLDDGVLIETHGRKMRRLPLAELRRIDVSQGLAVAAFRRGRVRIPAGSFASGLATEDRRESFTALTQALAAQGAASSPRLQVSARGAAGWRDAVVWIIALSASGAVAILFAAAAMGALALGLALAARLTFALILALAVWPWLDRGAARDGTRRINAN